MKVKEHCSLAEFNALGIITTRRKNSHGTFRKYETSVQLRHAVDEKSAFVPHLLQNLWPLFSSKKGIMWQVTKLRGMIEVKDFIFMHVPVQCGNNGSSDDEREWPKILEEMTRLRCHAKEKRRIRLPTLQNFRIKCDVLKKSIEKYFSYNFVENFFRDLIRRIRQFRDPKYLAKIKYFFGGTLGTSEYSNI